ncbi:Internalin-J, partial [termite gut metagenome]
MKKLRLIGIILCFPLLIAAQQPGKMTQKFFPDPDVTIQTPSFQKKKGYADYNEIISYIERTIEGKNIATLEYIGETQKGKKIPAVTIKKPIGNDKVKVMFTGRVHGDEPAGTEALLMLIDKLLNDEELSFLTEKIDIAILPIINIDGGEKLKRQSDNGIDLNRDMSKLQAPETVALRLFFNRFDPDVFIDFHEYLPFRADYVKL